MELLIVAGLVIGGVSVIRSLLLGKATSRQPPRHCGIYINPDYALKMGRASRSEYAANRQLAGK